MDSNQSKSTEISPRKQRHHYISADSNSGSYDTSHGHGKESTRRRPYKRKVMLDKGPSKYKKCKSKYEYFIASYFMFTHYRNRRP